jgi:hypothetical protein
MEKEKKRRRKEKKRKERKKEKRERKNLPHSNPFEINSHTADLHDSQNIEIYPQINPKDFVYIPAVDLRQTCSHRFQSV